MQVLSYTPNSEKIFATALQKKAANHPDVLRSSIRASLSVPSSNKPSVETVIEEGDDEAPAII